jgi:DNA modification methylase
MRRFFECSDVTIWQGDSREAWKHLPEQSADAIVTSPPYFGLRDYGQDGQIGLEPSPDEYVTGLADLLTGYGERVLKPGGSLWLNLGDTYGGMRGNKNAAPQTKHAYAEADTPGHGKAGTMRKCLLMIPERVALALISRGWILRNRVVWAKPNGMPSSVRDRLATKHEALFHLVRQPRYFYDLDAIREDYKSPNPGKGGLNKRGDESFIARAGLSAAGKWDGEVKGANPGDWWVIPTQPYPDAHFAVFPPELVRRPILATVPEGGTVLDPFFGSGTTAVMARRLGRKTVGIELNPDYCRLAADRFRQDVLTFDDEGAA